MDVALTKLDKHLRLPYAKPCCRICPNVFYSLNPAPWLPLSVQKQESMDPYKLAKPKPKKAGSLIQEMVRVSMHTSLKAYQKQQEKQHQHLTPGVKCCNICPMSYNRDALWNEMIDYKGWIPKENGMEGKKARSK